MYRASPYFSEIGGGYDERELCSQLNPCTIEFSNMKGHKDKKIKHISHG